MAVVGRRVKRAVEGVLSGDLATRVGQRRMVRRGLVLAYHNVIPTSLGPVGEAALHVPVDAFARQLDILMERARVVPLTHLISGDGASADDRRPPVAVTFDDGYRGALTFGLRELRSRHMPATFFIAPGLLGDQTLWWDAAADPSTGVLADTRSHALERLGGRSDAIREWALTEGLRFQPMPPECRTVTEDELAGVQDVEGVTLAGHSWHHTSLTHLETEGLRTELKRALEWMRRWSAAPWLAYPYGHASPRVRQAAEACGYTCSFLVEGGWLPRKRTSSFDLPRLSVPAGLSPEGFGARLAGFLSRA